MLEDADHDTVKRAFLLVGAITGFLGAFTLPMVYGTVAYLLRMVGVWLKRPAVDVIVAAWGMALVVVTGYGDTHWRPVGISAVSVSQPSPPQ